MRNLPVEDERNFRNPKWIDGQDPSHKPTALQSGPGQRSKVMGSLENSADALQTKSGIILDEMREEGWEDGERQGYVLWGWRCRLVR